MSRRGQTTQIPRARGTSYLEYNGTSTNNSERKKEEMFSCHLLVTSLFVSLFVYFLLGLQKRIERRESHQTRAERLSSRLESIEVE